MNMSAAVFAKRASRELLLLSLALGCAVSALATGRLSARGIVDGAISFAFVPAIEVVAFWLIYRRARSRPPFGRALGLFLAGNRPWLLWLVCMIVAGFVVWPDEPITSSSGGVSLIALIPLVPALWWSASDDLSFYRSVMKRTRHEARVDAVLFRAIAWPLAGAYYGGIAAWPIVLTWLHL